MESSALGRLCQAADTIKQSAEVLIEQSNTHERQQAMMQLLALQTYFNQLKQEISQRSERDRLRTAASEATAADNKQARRKAGRCIQLEQQSAAMDGFSAPRSYGRAHPRYAL